MFEAVVDALEAGVYLVDRDRRSCTGTTERKGSRGTCGSKSRGDIAGTKYWRTATRERRGFVGDGALCSTACASGSHSRLPSTCGPALVTGRQCTCVRFH